MQGTASLCRAQETSSVRARRARRKKSCKNSPDRVPWYTLYQKLAYFQLDYGRTDLDTVLKSWRLMSRKWMGWDPWLWFRRVSKKIFEIYKSFFDAHQIRHVKWCQTRKPISITILSFPGKTLINKFARKLYHSISRNNWRNHNMA